MKKFKLATAALAAAMSVSVFSPFTTQAQEEPVEVTFWHAMNGPHQEMITELVEGFNESQDQYVVVEQNQGDYSTLSQSIMASGVSGDLPTLAQLTSSNTPDYRDQGLLTPLDAYLTEENGWSQELKDGIFEGFMTGVTYEDGIYAMPFSKSVRLMYVNQDLLDEVEAEIPRTWEEVKALGEALDEAGIENEAMGLENSISMEVETMARQNGAEWISSDLSTVDIASETAVEPVNFIKDLINNGHVRQAGEDGFMSGPFSQGETALYIGSSAGLPHVLPGIEENSINMVTAEIPVFNEGENLTLFAGNDLGVFASASEEERAGAAAFLAYLLEADNTAKWAIGTGYLPITKAGLETDLWQDYLAENPYVEAASAELEYGQSQVPYVGSSEVFSEIELALENIMINDADTQAEMQVIEDLVKGHLGVE
ncbi:ABC transporter substrate-binding protein [Aerococcaceae bacterium WGS1372]